jgi:hypothetical protein
MLTAALAAMAFPLAGAFAQPRPPMPPPAPPGSAAASAGSPQLALVGRSLAVEWPSLGVDLREMALKSPIRSRD